MQLLRRVFIVQKVQLLRDENKAVFILSQHYNFLTRFSPLGRRRKEGLAGKRGLYTRPW